MDVNLIIDGNFLLFRDVFILKRIDSIYQDLVKLLKEDIKNITKHSFYKHIYFVSDMGKSWRKSIYEQYKENRKKDDSIDWDFVYSAYDDFMQQISSENKNITIHKKDGLEGDDIIAYLVREGNKKGYSNVVVAADKDLTQVIDYNINENWINIQWNYTFSNETVYLPEGYKYFLNHISNKEVNIFEYDNSFEFAEYFEMITSRSKRLEIDKERMFFCKIVSGDKGDNVDSIVYVNERGIGEVGAEKFYSIYKELYPEKIDFESDDFKNKLVDLVYHTKKLGIEALKKNILDRINENIMLMKLDVKYMPEKFRVELESIKLFE